jgi:transcriptional regulator with XRE-family HTH domain
VSIGEALAEARGQAGLTVAEVSQRTRIRETIISGIERDDYSACGGDFYARGNIRSIASVVGADPEPLISEYDAVHRAPGALSAVSLDELVTTARTSAQRRPNWTTVLGLALVVALGFAACSFIQARRTGATPPPGRQPCDDRPPCRARRDASGPEDQPGTALRLLRHTTLQDAISPVATVRLRGRISGHRQPSMASRRPEHGRVIFAVRQRLRHHGRDTWYPVGLG